MDILIKNLSKEQYAFFLSFAASCFKRICSTLILYSKHNNKVLSSINLMKCIKYNMLSPTGIFNEIEPYLLKALEQGFLMPNEFKKNLYAERAISLFSDTYKIGSVKDEKIKKRMEYNFIHNFASDIDFKDKKEEKDIIKNIPNYEENKLGNEHICSFCELVNIWEIGNLYTLDYHQNIITYFILRNLN